MKRRIISLLILLAVLLSLTPLIVTGSSAEESEGFLHGREILSSLSNAEEMLYVYDKLLLFITCYRDSVDIDEKYYVTSAELERVFQAIFADYPELFILAPSYGYVYYVGKDKIKSFHPTYTMSQSDYDKAKLELEAAVSEMTKGLDGKSDYEKSLILHDRLAEKVTYELSPNDQNVYGALVEGRAVCAGYARAYQLLMNRVGIPTWYVTGESYAPYSNVKSGHAWNVVKLGDKFYYTDVTWDDQESGVKYSYFNLPSVYFDENHFRDTKGLYLYYDLTADDSTMMYFAKNGIVADSYDRATLGNLLKDGKYTASLFVIGDIDKYIFDAENDSKGLAEALGWIGGAKLETEVFGRELIITVTNTPPEPETEPSPESTAPETENDKPVTQPDAAYQPGEITEARHESSSPSTDTAQVKSGCGSLVGEGFPVISIILLAGLMLARHKKII